MRSAPLSGTACVGRGGYDRPSPLEKGAVAAEGGGWGFLLFCRGCGDGPKQRNPPSRLRRATSLFKGGFWRADIVRPYEGARRGQAPALRCTPEPMARSAEDARVSVKRENLRPAPPAPVPAQKVPLPTLPPCPVGCARLGAPRGGRGWRPPPRPGPSGPEGGAPRHSIPSRRLQPPSPRYGSPSLVNGGSQGERGVRRPTRSIAEGAVSVPAPPERLFGDFLAVQKVTRPGERNSPPPVRVFAYFLRAEKVPRPWGEIFSKPTRHPISG